MDLHRCRRSISHVLLLVDVIFSINNRTYNIIKFNPVRFKCATIENTTCWTELKIKLHNNLIETDIYMCVSRDLFYFVFSEDLFYFVFSEKSRTLGRAESIIWAVGNSFNSHRHVVASCKLLGTNAKSMRYEVPRGGIPEFAERRTANRSPRVCIRGDNNRRGSRNPHPPQCC